MAGQSTVVLAMIIAALAVQSINSKAVGDVQDNGMDGLLALIGDTVTSIKNLPFAWAHKYEIAIVYNTGKWSEITISEKPAQMKLAKRNYLDCLIKIKNILFDLMKQMNANERETAVVQSDVSSWHNKIADLVNKDGDLPKDADLTLYQKRFNNLFSILTGKAKNVNDATLLADTKVTVANTTEDMMKELVKSIKHATKEFQDLANENSDSI
ncbi:uncharacterized protein LOC126845938 isoform X5 [Adelges cooleyi]|uniref:uncharacterized protein LOC126845938 isoform X5 n=1 Tax=Adelges cooleyi TaxID=133065 RepID=UPI0021802F40|nr:uncharacterized protein LOC126845938 isoform X5 [Adelges cooleyi]